jgi:SAM-dependent methyltransferase
VDRTRQYLHEAKQLARKESLRINFVRGDMRVFRQANTFDLVVNLFTAFGYFNDPQDDRKVVRNIHASLKKGGWLVMDLLGKEVLARQPLVPDQRRQNVYHQTDDAGVFRGGAGNAVKILRI